LLRPSIQVMDEVDDLQPLFEQCAVTINPLLELRGSSLKVIESLAFGRVCLSTKAGARGHDAAGFRGLVALPSLEAFVDPLAQLLNNEERRLALEPPELDKLTAYRWEQGGRALRSYLAGVMAAAG
jgi:glycosyltransferase involved in cell wall biosynthesis